MARVKKTKMERVRGKEERKWRQCSTLPQGRRLSSQCTPISSSHQGCEPDSPLMDVPWGPQRAVPCGAEDPLRPQRQAGPETR